MFNFTPDKIKESRLSICINCPSSKNNAFGLTCGKFAKKTKTTCGCLVMAKVQFIDQKCPQNKW